MIQDGHRIVPKTTNISFSDNSSVAVTSLDSRRSRTQSENI